jgi:PPM family protein phosphatase
MEPVPSQHPPPPAGLSWSGMTHRGKVRANNEDAFLALAFDGHEMRYLGKVGQASFEKTDFLFAVSDGLGGANSGEFASRITVEKISHLLPKSFRNSARGIAPGFADILLELFGSVHQDLVRLGRSYEECRGMGTTLSVCWLTPGLMHLGHIGDSRIYHLPGAGGLTQVTHDHSHVGWLRRQGKLTEREARSHPMKNAVHQALGASNQFVEPQVGSVPCAAGDRFLICSDGLSDGLWDRHLEELLREPAPGLAATLPAERLVAASLENSGNDNTTAVVVELLEVAPVPST